MELHPIRILVVFSIIGDDSQNNRNLQSSTSLVLNILVVIINMHFEQLRISTSPSQAPIKITQSLH